MITGELTVKGPGGLAANTPLDPGQGVWLFVDGNLMDGSKSPLDFWQGCFTGECGSKKFADRFSGTGTVIGPDPTGSAFDFGSMPKIPLTIDIKLWANDSLFADWDWYGIEELGWKQIKYQRIIIEPIGWNGNGNGGAKEFPWKWVAIGGGAVALLIAIKRIKG